MVTEQNDITLVKRRDKRIASFSSNLHGPRNVNEVTSKSKDGSITMIPCPIVVNDYNSNIELRR